MELTWLSGQGVQRDCRCPVCDSLAPKAAVLRVSEAIVSDTLLLLACPGCTSLFYDDLSVAKYEEQDIIPGLAERYYLEQGAGLDWLVQLLYRVDRHRVQRYLEVGCGYGLLVDYASRVFGWQAKGIDPSPLAAMGRSTLGVDIEARYLGVGERPVGAPFDLVYCSEVIEHVADPRAFVDTLRAQLTPAGHLMLTTPNAQTVVPGSPMLAPVLSPGKHLILFTRSSLQQLLRQAGFAHVVVEASRDSLLAFASNSPLAEDAAGLDAEEFKAYLARRADDFAPGHPLALGYRYRLFKALVNEGSYAAADAVFQANVPVMRETFGLDLTCAAENLAARQGADLGGLFAGMPFNVTGWLYFKGVIALNTNPDKAEAAAYFDAALRSGLMIRHIFATFEMEDGEIENLSKLARLHAIFCLADTDRERGRAELARIRHLPPDLTERYAAQWVVGDAEEADFIARFAARYPDDTPVAVLAPSEEEASHGWLSAARRWLGLT